MTAADLIAVLARAPAEAEVIAYYVPSDEFYAIVSAAVVTDYLRVASGSSREDATHCQLELRVQRFEAGEPVAE